MDAPKHANRLAREKSPYLLQHALNPVDWFAWNEEAFASAHAQNKPIFLSIGYATCHWCHVMERESFEDENVGTFLRDHFISIKVDREERPDVDKIYMTFVQSTTGGGGWPLNVFLTPDLKPFFGGTYFPPDTRHGRPGFLELLRHISQLWSERHGDIVRSADELHARLDLITARAAPENGLLTTDMLRQAFAAFKAAYDPANGGFGDAPKFPQPAMPMFVLRAASRFDDPEAVSMVLHTCRKMAAGGIHDQLGGGFARYAVDAQWLVPHFEKMLYDNAQLAQLYLDAHLLAKDQDPAAGTDSAASFAGTVRDILDYVSRDMTHPSGGFYSAEDANSDGHEGKFYCWTHDELTRLLDADEFRVAATYFGITKEGNFVDHSHPHPLPGQNVLSIARPLEQPSATNLPSQPPSSSVAQRSQTSVPPEEAMLSSAKAKMLAARAFRHRPLLDDKILVSWNGLMLGAFARASVILDDETYRLKAENNLAFIREKMWVSPVHETQDKPGDPRPVAAATETSRGRGAGVGTLFHRWRDGERDHVQLLEGYAFLLDGVIQLYEAGLDPAHLQFACELASAMIDGFYDAANGGFWQSPADTGDLILRIKDDYDGAEPSGNSLAALALLKLAAITGRTEFRRAAEATLRLFAARMRSQPTALACMLQALDLWLNEPCRVVVAGDRQSPKFRALLRAAHSVYRPRKIVLGNTGPVTPFTKTLTSTNEAAVYVCFGDSCQAPTSDPAIVSQLLRRAA